MNTYCESCLDATRETVGPQFYDSTSAVIAEFMSIYSTELVDHDCESIEYPNDTMCDCKYHV